MRTMRLGQRSRTGLAVPGTARKVLLFVFSVGGRRMAAYASEVARVGAWTEAIPVPSATPGMTAVLRHGDDILPVFDLAGRLNVQVTSESPLCLVVKRQDGPMAVRIDGEIPVLQLVEEQAIRPVAWKETDVRATCQIGTEEVPVYSLADLGLGLAGSHREASGGGYG